MSTSTLRAPNVSIRGPLIVACLGLARQPGRLGASPPDSDGDGVVDDLDNRLDVPNAAQTDPDLDPAQVDWDADGIGDACADADGDGLVDAADNCMEVPNPGQQDTDQDDFGNACDGDFDRSGSGG